MGCPSEPIFYLCHYLDLEPGEREGKAGEEQWQNGAKLSGFLSMPSEEAS